MQGKMNPLQTQTYPKCCSTNIMMATFGLLTALTATQAPLHPTSFTRFRDSDTGLYWLVLNCPSQDSLLILAALLLLQEDNLLWLPFLFHLFALSLFSSPSLLCPFSLHSVTWPIYPPVARLITWLFSFILSFQMFCLVCMLKWWNTTSPISLCSFVKGFLSQLPILTV